MRTTHARTAQCSGASVSVSRACCGGRRARRWSATSRDGGGADAHHVLSEAVRERARIVARREPLARLAHGRAVGRVREVAMQTHERVGVGLGARRVKAVCGVMRRRACRVARRAASR